MADEIPTYDSAYKLIDPVELADLLGRAIKEIETLREENAELHKQAEMNGRLLTENAELREALGKRA